MYLAVLPHMASSLVQDDYWNSSYWDYTSASKKEECLLRTYSRHCTYNSTYIPLSRICSQSTPNWRKNEKWVSTLDSYMPRSRLATQLAGSSAKGKCGVPCSKVLRTSRWQQHSIKLILGPSEHCTLGDGTGHMPMKLILIQVSLKIGVLCLMKRRKKTNIESMLHYLI